MTAPRSIRVGLLAYGLDRPATGIPRYAVELAKALSAAPLGVEVVLLQPFDRPIASLEHLERVRLRAARLLPALMSVGALELAVVAHRHRLDVVHDPAGVAPFVPIPGLRRPARVVTIHDMVPFVYPETHQPLTRFLFRRYMPVTLRWADKVITVSDASRRDFERYLPIAKGRVERIWCGVSAAFAPQPGEVTERAKQRYGLPNRYILAVGSLHPRKNLETALRSFVQLRNSGATHNLVLVGPRAWKSESLFAAVADPAVADHVHLTGYVDDADLPAIYSGADCLVFPSLYEGFGLPPLEAMACGTPVVASDTSSIPEVVGDAALLVPPRDVDAMTAAVSSVLSDSELADRLRASGFDRARRFTWAAAAEAHAHAYRSAMSLSGRQR